MSTPTAAAWGAIPTAPARPRAFVLRCSDLELDTSRHEGRRGGVLLTLTGKEFAVLHRLLATPGEPVRRADLLAAAWDELVPPATNVLDVLIAQLRGKLGEPRVIHTVRGTGYLLGQARGTASAAEVAAR
ncbi:winged helix-turn-helix domain-containing protein [Amycolatopsis sp. NPDC058278]|uniref:winged helix-turn-helix domain-containing protein n=1 Tax=Amycolatopsis sp. NPDC058278 TaxID=3346417 RepID=UPI0036DE215F